jgi:uroporphyrinogen-III synthase
MTASAPALAGRRILLTRSAEDCADWAEKIEQRGARAVLLPCIRTEPIDTPELRATLARALAKADWLVLTSRRGVEAFAELRGDESLPHRTRVAVVGAATANVAKARLGRADLVGGGTAAKLADEIADEIAPDRSAPTNPAARPPSVLIAVAENAADVLETTLADAGARCTRLDVYRTIPAPPSPSKRPVSSLGAASVVGASPAAPSGLGHQVELDAPVEIYTIGPSTTAAAQALGLAVTAEAREPSLDGILEAMQ